MGVLLAIEPVGEAALPGPQGVRLLGMVVARRHAWPVLRHVFDLNEEAALHVDVGPYNDPIAFAVGYDAWGDELLTPL